MLINIQLKTKDQKPPHQMFPFPWDNTEQQEQESIEIKRARFEYLKEKWKDV